MIPLAFDRRVQCGGTHQVVMLSRAFDDSSARCIAARRTWSYSVVMLSRAFDDSSNIVVKVNTGSWGSRNALTSVR